MFDEVSWMGPDPSQATRSSASACSAKAATAAVASRFARTARLSPLLERLASVGRRMLKGPFGIY
jgi:hypothetical protein